MADSGKTDAEMSMAIDNLSAILGVDDVDKVIELLQQNNWDESAAAQTYYAQQAQQEMNQRPAAATGLNHSIQTNEEEYEREHGVRSPINYQEDQLVGGDENVGLLGVTPLQMMQMQHMQHMQQQRMTGQQQPMETPQNRGRMLQRGLPQRAPMLSYENLADTNEDRSADGNAVDEGQPGMARRFFRAVRGGFTAAFSWCNSEDEELQNVERASSEALQMFRAKFEEQYLSLVGQPSRLQCFAESFPRLCVNSRRDKKPVLVLVTRTQQDECFIQALTSLSQAEAARDMIRERFIFAGFSMDQPPIEQLGQIISLGNAEAALYFVVVQHDAKVQMLRKLNLSATTSGSELYDYLSETANLFTILAEEDPGYLQQEVLQNAGILPVGQNQQQRRNTGMERPSPREADPDALLRAKQRREYEEAQVQDQMRQIERQEQESKARATQQAAREAEEQKQEDEELNEAIEFERKERAKWLSERMPEEPEAGGPDVTEVVLRAQGSGKRFTRRFLKTEKVAILYNFVRTLAEEDLGFDDQNAQFQICQPFPRKAFAEDADQTLEQLGIFPRAALQIQEVTAD